MVYPGTLFIGDNGAFLCIPMKIGVRFEQYVPGEERVEHRGRLAERLLDGLAAVLLAYPRAGLS
jgi:hypothetical protein